MEMAELMVVTVVVMSMSDCADVNGVHDDDDEKMRPPKIIMRNLNLATWGEWHVALAKYIYAEFKLRGWGKNQIVLCAKFFSAEISGVTVIQNFICFTTGTAQTMITS